MTSEAALPAAQAAKRYDVANLAVLGLQLTAWGLSLSALHASLPLWSKALIVLFFCLMMQGVFSMIHECIHELGHSNKSINYVMGVLASTIFGTTYTLFEVNHDGHHVRNRSRAELVDFILPGESAFKKIAVYYFAILGGIWLGGFLGSILLPLVPYRYRGLFSWDKEDNTYSTAILQIKPRDWSRLRWELAFAVAFWLASAALFGWNWLTLIEAYAAFAFSWSSLQWIYHIGTPLHVVEGAYNLRLPAPVRWLFLNFNYNLTHHRQPRTPWQELHAVSNLQETQPLWYRYFRLFVCPQPLPPDPASIQKVYF